MERIGRKKKSCERKKGKGTGRTYRKKGRELEGIIYVTEAKLKSVSAWYKAPSLGAAVSSGALIYMDNLEYGIGAAALAVTFGLIGHLKKKSLKEDLRRSYLEKFDIKQRIRDLKISFIF